MQRIPGKAAPGRQADHSPLSSAEVTDGAVLPLPHTPSWRAREQLNLYLVREEPLIRMSSEDSPMSFWYCLSLVRAVKLNLIIITIISVNQQVRNQIVCGDMSKNVHKRGRN